MTMLILYGFLQALVFLSIPQQLENPEYKYWVGFKAGSWVKYKFEAPGAPATMEIQQLRTLVEITPDKVKLDQADLVIMNGKERPSPPSPNTYDAKCPKEQKIVSQKEEELEVAGKKLKCLRVEMLTEGGGAKITVIHWMAAEIPGGIAKTEYTTEIGGQASRTIKFSALAWERK
jgi:hypothetical protein